MMKRSSLKKLSSESLIIINGIAAVILAAAMLTLLPGRKLSYSGNFADQAAQKMSAMLTYIASERSDAITDHITDPYRTGLIGPELSEITTTIGDPAAKRTTLNPAFASLIAMLLSEAGVKPGDTIAAGCSGSFPGLLIATLAATEAMGVHPQIILSLGSSFHGASDIQFTILDLYMTLFKSGFIRNMPIAVTPGGENDTGGEMDPETVARLKEKAEMYSVPMIAESSLVRNRVIRDSLYTAGGSAIIKAFVNSGGGVANMGSSTLSLSLKPGLVRRAPIPPFESRGVIHDMLLKEIPVIHLLYIKGLTSRYGIDWDADPFNIRETPHRTAGYPWYMTLIAVVSLVWFGVLIKVLSTKTLFKP